MAIIWANPDADASPPGNLASDSPLPAWRSKIPASGWGNSRPDPDSKPSNAFAGGLMLRASPNVTRGGVPAIPREITDRQSASLASLHARTALHEADSAGSTAHLPGSPPRRSADRLGA